MTKLTYFEPLLDGHCTFWARMILTKAARDPRLTGLRLVTSSEMLVRLEPYLSGLSIEAETIAPEQLKLMTSGPLWRRGRTQWLAAKKYARDSVVFLPFLDHAVVAAAIDPIPITGGGRVSGIIFRPPNTYGLPVTARHRMDALRRWITYIMARRVSRGPFFTLDELITEKTSSGKDGTLIFLPDPAPETAMLVSATPRQRNDGRCVVLMFGALTHRKGIFQILDVWQLLAPEVRERLVLRFVGRLDAAIRAPFLEKLEKARAILPDATIELEDRFVTDEALASEVLGAAILVAPYQNHTGSSGVMHWAVAAGKPLIAQETGLIGYQVKRYQLGTAVDCTDLDKLAGAITTVDRRTKAASAAFAALHTPDNFVRTILDELIRTAGRVS